MGWEIVAGINMVVSVMEELLKLKTQAVVEKILEEMVYIYQDSSQKKTSRRLQAPAQYPDKKSRGQGDESMFFELDRKSGLGVSAGNMHPDLGGNVLELGLGYFV